MANLIAKIPTAESAVIGTEQVYAVKDNTTDVRFAVQAIIDKTLDDVTAEDVGLELVNNTSDAAKPISTAQGAKNDLQDAAIEINTGKRTYPLADEQKLATVAANATPDQDLSAYETTTQLNQRAALKLNITDLVNNLTSGATDRPLTAAQGQVLKGFIDNINTLIGSDETTLDTLQEIVDFIEINRSTLDNLSIAGVAGLQNALDAKQATLISGTNIKTVNGEAVLGTGNLVTPDTNTTYTEITVAEIAAGTAATLRTMTGRRAGYLLGLVITRVLTGLSTATSTAVVATDTILAAIGKLQAQVSLKANGLGAFNNQTGTAYTLALTDIFHTVTMSNAAANTLTIPPNADVAFEIGAKLLVKQGAAGSTTIAAGAGVTIYGDVAVTLEIAAEGGYRGLQKTGVNDWDIL